MLSHFFTIKNRLECEENVMLQKCPGASSLALSLFASLATRIFDSESSQPLVSRLVIAPLWPLSIVD